jgi:hypothetical protein
MPAHIQESPCAFLGLLASLSLLSLICAQEKPPSLAAADKELIAYLAKIDAAEAHLRLNETGAARRWLDAVPDSRRTSFEWGYLAAQAEKGIEARKRAPIENLEQLA